MIRLLIGSVVTATVGCGLGWVAVPMLAQLLAPRAVARAGAWGEESIGEETHEAVRATPHDGRWRDAGALGAFCAALVLMGLGPLEVGLLAVAGVALAAAALCDVRVGLIPWETCAVVGATGLAVQARCLGLGGVCWGALYAGAVIVACCALNARFGRRGKCGIGGGDVRCMAALSLASGQAAPLGLLASCLAMVFMGVRSRIVEGRRFDDPRPMAPAFAPWLLCAAIWCAAATAA